MKLRNYLGERYIEELVIKQIGNASDIRLFSRDEAVAFVDTAFTYIEDNNLAADMMTLEKRIIAQLVYRIATRFMEEYLWQVQIEMGLAGKMDTPDGPIYFFTQKAEDLGERKASFNLSVELARRRGTSPIW